MRDDLTAKKPPAAKAPRPETVGTTRLDPLPARGWWLPGAFFLLTLVFGAVTALLTPATFRWPRVGSFWHGEQAARYEDAFNDALPFRDAAIATWGVLEYTLFHEGQAGVVVGQGGWLYTHEEVAFYPDAEAETARKLAYIEQVRDELTAKDIALVVALVPDKTRVYAEHLGRPLPSFTGERYASFRTQLTEAGVLTPDLLNPLRAAKPERQVYLRTDTHWTPAGAEVAAEALAAVLKRATIPGLFASSYETEVTGQEAYRGDLLNFLPLGVLQNRLGPPPDRLELHRTAATTTAATEAAGDAGSAGGLFGEQSIPVTLIGTSYSANERWNFTGALKEALGADVLNLSSEGQGPLPPMRDYLNSAELRDDPPSLIVWEIPERYLPAPEAM